MKFRFKAFGIHLLSSFTALLLVLGTLYLGWYQWPAWRLLDILSLVAVMAGVDLVLGPLLTLLIASPAKTRRELARDIGVIAAVQVGALAYATYILWIGRPLYYTFSADRLEVVRAFEIEAADRAAALELNPSLAPHWYSRPRWVWAQMPEDAEVAGGIIQSAISGGPDIVNMPRYFRPWEQGLAELRRQLKPISGLKMLTTRSHARVAARARDLQLPDTQANAMIMTGRSTPLVALFDLDTMQQVALISTD
jgi:hypothetical protein